MEFCLDMKFLCAGLLVPSFLINKLLNISPLFDTARCIQECCKSKTDFGFVSSYHSSKDISFLNKSQSFPFSLLWKTWWADTFHMTQEELNPQSLAGCPTVPDCWTLLQESSLGSCPVLPRWGGSSLPCPRVLLIHWGVKVMLLSLISHLEVPLVTLCILHMSSSFSFVSQVLCGSWLERHDLCLGQGEGCGAGQREQDLPEEITHTQSIMSCPPTQSIREKEKSVISWQWKEGAPLASCQRIASYLSQQPVDLNFFVS